MMANFFSKSSNKMEDTNERLEKEGSVEILPESLENNLIEDKNEIEVAMESDQKEEEVIDNSDLKNGDVKGKEEIKQKSKKNNKRKSGNKSSQVAKRRKRIIENDDCSDSDSNIPSFLYIIFYYVYL